MGRKTVVEGPTRQDTVDMYEALQTAGLCLASLLGQICMYGNSQTDMEMKDIHYP